MVHDEFNVGVSKQKRLYYSHVHVVWMLMLAAGILFFDFVAREIGD